MGMLEFGGLKFLWLGHAGFAIKNEKTVYIDPFEIRGGEKADIIFITHEHFDHCSPEDLKKIVSEKTLIVTISSCKDPLSKLKVKEVKVVKPGDMLNVEGIEVEAIPAYNLTKFRSPGVPFHPKQEAKVGYLLNIGGTQVYHAGDTDFTEDFKQVKAGILLIPVSGTYVMTADEAAEAANYIKPRLAIPMHYGAIVGDRSDAEKFKEQVACEVQILEKE